MINRLNAFPIKILAGIFLVKIDKLILKFIQKDKESRATETFFEKEEFGRSMLPGFKIYYKETGQGSTALA